MTQTSSDYHKNYSASINNPQDFWAEQAQQLISWNKPWQTIMQGTFGKTPVSWFVGAELNACYNCLDRHLPQHKDKVALYWEGNTANVYREITYGELHEEVCRLANALKQYKISKGDAVCIYLPMIPEAIVAMLACARIGAMHTVVFAGFSAEALMQRIVDSNSKLLITADFSLRGKKTIPLKEQYVDKILTNCPNISKVIVVKRTENEVPMLSGRDLWYHKLIQDQKTECDITPIAATDPLFLLYTSGSTGRPKGILHVAGGYLVYVASTFKNVFDIQANDIYFCAADIGWITGHSYMVYGPMSHGTTQVMFEGIPTYPTPDRLWQIIDKYKVNILYTAPTAIRSLMRYGDDNLTSTSRGSLKCLGSVGEPINPEAWQWYYEKVGNKKCPIVDTWWQTETGGIMLSPLPNITPLKPGAACWPFYGIKPAIVDDEGNELTGECQGNLVISQPWPGLMHTIFQDTERMFNVYFKQFPGYYLTGDSATRDADGDYWITGRNDDVMNVSGHRLGSAEIENAITQTPHIIEAAVVDVPHPIKGQAIYAFVVPNKNCNEDNDSLKHAIITTITQKLGPFAKPEAIQFTHELPKTRSGKIMRRLLRKIAAGDTDNLGDTSTLSNPDILDTLR